MKIQLPPEHTLLSFGFAAALIGKEAGGSENVMDWLAWMHDAAEKKELVLRWSNGLPIQARGRGWTWTQQEKHIFAGELGHWLQSKGLYVEHASAATGATKMESRRMERSRLVGLIKKYDSAATATWKELWTNETLKPTIRGAGYSTCAAFSKDMGKELPRARSGRPATKSRNKS